MTKFRMINGKPTPITPKKGGAAIVFAVVVGGVIAYTSSGGGAGAAVDSVADSSLGGKTSSGKADASKGNYEQAWTRLGLRQLKRKAEKALKCDVSSYGQVQHFFSARRASRWTAQCWFSATVEATRSWCRSPGSPCTAPMPPSS